MVLSCGWGATGSTQIYRRFNLPTVPPRASSDIDSGAGVPL
jgi:hypothetical protein